MTLFLKSARLSLFSPFSLKHTSELHRRRGGCALSYRRVSFSCWDLCIIFFPPFWARFVACVLPERSGGGEAEGGAERWLSGRPQEFAAATQNEPSLNASSLAHIAGWLARCGPMLLSVCMYVTPERC